ncbi:helix-turn-helix domain-containing protein [Cellulosimicrobium funkei]|uniref:helix-turn-helix domain-containing protein n=1 Tax=Cellulosimicrobium funkei TaxID=264251 RepID=UPI0036511596
MHALRAFVEQQMNTRAWTNQDLVRASGITKQVISELLKDTRERVTSMPSDKTIDGLSRAFGVDRSLVLTKIGEAMGLPVSEPVVVFDASGVSNDELLRELATRLGTSEVDHGNTAPTRRAAGSAADRDAGSSPPRSAVLTERSDGDAHPDDLDLAALPKPSGGSRYERDAAASAGLGEESQDLGGEGSA